MGENGSTDVVTNTKWFILVSVIQKIVTFALNQTMIATTSPEVLGEAAIQLELLLSTLLFLSREGIRLTALRHKIISKNEFQAVINLSWLPPIAVTTFIIMITIFRNRLFPDYNFTVIYMYSFAALIECIGEPCYNIFQNTGNIKPRLSAETSAVFAKSVVTVFCVAYLNLGVNGFGLAQVSYGIIYLLVLLTHWTSAKHSMEFNQNHFRLWDMLPKPLQYNQTSPSLGILNYLFGSDVISIALTLTGSSLLKHILTESDKIALTFTSSTYNQGIYAVTNNYGSLAARMIYLPLEDSSRLAFSKLAHEFRGNMKNSIKLKNLSEECSSLYIELKNTFIYLIRLVIFTGIFFIIFGIPYIPILVQYIFSIQWRSNETINSLSMYCIYLFVMGINGISESFVQSTAPPAAFMSLNIGLLLSSLGFIIIAMLSVPSLGTSGIILANIISMMIRIFNNGLYIIKMFTNPEIFLHTSVENDRININKLNTLIVQPKECLLWFFPPILWIFNAIFCTITLHISLYFYQLSIISEGKSHYAAVVHILIGSIVAVLFLIVTIYYSPIEIYQSIWNKIPVRLQLLLSKQKKIE